MVEKLGTELGYTGQLSLDFVETQHGLTLIECNPRATDGVLLMSAEELAAGLLSADGETVIVEPGRRTQLDLAVFGQVFGEGLHAVPASLSDLIRIRGADRGWHDALPRLYSFLAFVHHERLSHRERRQLFVAMSDGITWDGQAIPGMSPGDAGFLAGLTA